MLIWVAKIVALLVFAHFVITPLVTRFMARVQQKIADAIYALPQFAHLKQITPEFLQAMSVLTTNGRSLIAARDLVWSAHTDRFLDRLDAAFARAIGVKTLTRGQQKTLRAAFGARVPDAHTDPAAHAAFARRYEANDYTLIDDFLKEYVAGEQLLNARTAVSPAFPFDDAVPRWKTREALPPQLSALEAWCEDETARDPRQKH